ncbi:PPR: pentatricopeptide repeat domain containing protein [Nitzschia inconspicua]|uniref:PPR: pentatricopeptide repeat domain containing protein n=1 Tax=Nitzschia inconspicua TaxID=303405 RepID=A0A9K3M117_9STRA|nr:PPR: pentatricopeptide repeat domain containing protein [Nitzschia inconspicua]
MMFVLLLVGHLAVVNPFSATTSSVRKCDRFQPDFILPTPTFASDQMLPFREKSLLWTSYTADFENVDELKIEDDEEEVEEDDDMTLLLQFLDYCQETPVGEMELQDAELLRGILQDFPDDLYGNEDVELETVMETLFYRLLDEWSLTNQQLDSGDEVADAEYLMEKELSFRPNSMDFERAIAAWHRSNNPDKVVRVLNILSDQREIVLRGSGETALPDARPTLKSIEHVMEILADSKERGLEKRAAMVVDSLASDYNMEPNATITGLLIQILAKSRGPRAAQSAEAMLREAVVKFPPGSEDGMNDIEVFNKVVTAWAKSRNDDGPQRAQSLIVFMDQLGSSQCAPNSRTFTSLIDAYAQTNEWSGVRNAESILNNVLDLHLEGGHDLEPNVATWTIVISAYARLCKNPKTQRRHLSECGRRAGMLLRRMESLHESGRLSAGPDAITYVTVLNAYAFSKDRGNIEEAENLLDEMNEKYLDGDDSMKPSVRSIKVMVDAWIKQGVMEKAEELWEKYEEFLEEPKISKEDLDEIYHAFLHGYCQIGDGRRAKVYLDQMLEDGIEPKISCYDRIMDTYIKNGDKDCAEKAKEIFKIVETRRQEGSLVPNERVYTTFIRSMVKARVPGLYKKADLVLQRMNSLYESGLDDVKPSIFTYNVCLNACGESGYIEDTNKAEAFQTSVRLFRELKSTLDLDHVTFGNMLRCANLLPADSEKKEKFVVATFKLCCEKGLVNDLALRDLRNACTDDLWTTLTTLPAEIGVQNTEGLSDRLPLAWCRNVQPKKESFRPETRQRSYAGSSYRSR